MTDHASFAALARVDRLWRCTGCGYFAYSCPWRTVYFFGDQVGGYEDACPECGEQCWHWCGGDSREKRIAYAQQVSR
jgi:NAD-dependent dihydropyrimidine dehydrogenase PreA subunit